MPLTETAHAYDRALPWERVAKAKRMRRALKLLVFLLGTGAATVQPASRLMASPAERTGVSGPAQRAQLKAVSASSAGIASRGEEYQTEQQLLTLANQSRRQQGLAPLTLDEGLSKAALRHAQIMVEAHQLSHEFAGELALPQRLAAASSLLLDQEGENVALDYDAEHGHEHLMHSPPHRANLLNPAFNVVGLGVVRSGDQIYIVQDFGHAVPNYSSAELKDRVADAVQQFRRDNGQPLLERRDLLTADEIACSMEHADKLGPAPVSKLAERYIVLSYTSLNPRTLPDGASQALARRNLHAFSVGACYGRTTTYPTGVYWIVLALE
jgi:uncharacterized protein YkwD